MATASRPDTSYSLPPSPVGQGPDLLQLVVRARWMLLAGLLSGLVLGWLAYLKLGPSYQATARILVSKRTTVPLKSSEGSLQTWGERGEHVALIMSPLIVGEAVKVYKLGELRSLAGETEPIQEILADLKVRRSAGSDTSTLNVLDITFESTVPGDAAAVVNAVIKTYAAYLQRAQKEHQLETISLVEQANSELLAQLRTKEQEYLAFRHRAPLQWRNGPGTETQQAESTNVHQERVLSLEADRRQLLLRKTEVQSKLEAIEEARQRGESRRSLELLVQRFLNLDRPAAVRALSTESADLPISPLVPMLDARLLPLLLDEQRLLRDYGPDHPDVIAVRKSIATTKAFFRDQGLVLPEDLPRSEAPGPRGTRVQPHEVDLVAVYVDSLKQELSEIEFRDARLTALADEETLAAKSLASYQLEDRTLIDELKRLKGLWEIATNRLNEASVTRDNGGYSLKTVAPPREQLSVKRIGKIVGGGVAAGLVLAFGFVYARALTDTTIKSPLDVQQLLGFPILGRVPQLHIDRSLGGRTPFDPSLVFVHRPGSPEAEAYRSLRSAILVTSLNHKVRVLQISSPESGDGKSTLAANLALAMAQAGKKVLLVDGDLRRPRQQTLFRLRSDIGLSDVLHGELDLLTAIQATTFSGLSILGAGRTSANPAELLGSEAFAQKIAEARAQFDYVLVDSPPLLSVSDPCVIAPRTDGLLLVARIGKNRRAAIAQTGELLRTHGIQPLGIAINQVSGADAPLENYAYGRGEHPSLAYPDLAHPAPAASAPPNAYAPATSSP